jgi:hypothetical protein
MAAFASALSRVGASSNRVQIHGKIEMLLATWEKMCMEGSVLAEDHFSYAQSDNDCWAGDVNRSS